MCTNTDDLFRGQADLTQNGELLVGDRVRISDLVASAQYNTRVGRVISDERNGRWGVRLDGGRQSLAVREQNLQRLFVLQTGDEASVTDFAEPGLLPPLQVPLGFHDSDALFRALERRDSRLVPTGATRVDTKLHFNNTQLSLATSRQLGAGLGVFSGETPISRGAALTQYAGWHVDAQFQTHSPFLCVAGSLRVLGDPGQTHPQYGLGQFMNDAGTIQANAMESLEDALTAYEESSLQANVAFEEHEGVIVGFATEDIPPHTELLVTYGASFWLQLLEHRVAFVQDMELLRRLEHARERLEEGGSARSDKFPSVSLDTDGSLWNRITGKSATAEECQRVVRALLGHTFSIGRDEPVEDLVLTALLRGTPHEALPEVVTSLHEERRSKEGALILDSRSTASSNDTLAAQVRSVLRSKNAARTPSCSTEIQIGDSTSAPERVRAVQGRRRWRRLEELTVGSVTQGESSDGELCAQVPDDSSVEEPGG